MPFRLNTPSSQTLSFKLARWLFLGAAVLAAIYSLSPHVSAQYVLPAYFFVHGLICLWAAQEAFAGSGPASGCVPGIALWLAFSLEVMILGAVWLVAVGGPY